MRLTPLLSPPFKGFPSSAICPSRVRHGGQFYQSMRVLFSWTQLGLEHEINLRGAPYDLVKTLLELMTDVISEGSGEHVCLHNIFRVSLTSSIGPTLAPMTSRRQIQDGRPHDFRSKMAAPTAWDPRLGPHEVRYKMAAPVTRWLHLGGWVNALDHEKVASPPRARCRSFIYKGEGPLNYFRVVFFYEVQKEIQSLMV